MGVLLATGPIFVITAVVLFVRSTGSSSRRLWLAVSIAAAGTAMSLFTIWVKSHPTWLVPDALERGAPYCGLQRISPRSPCLTTAWAEVLDVQLWAGGAIAFFAAIAAARHRSSAGSRWSDAKVLGAILLTIAGLSIALVVLGLWFVSQFGH